MGITDRDYYRGGGSGFRLSVPRTAITTIILLNAAVFVAEVASQYSDPRSDVVVNALGCHVDAFDKHDDTLTRPWMWWQFLTYGFVHSPDSIQHILFNMLVLFFLGRDVEEWYGTREFIRLYLVSIVFAGLVWAITTRIVDGVSGPAIGASGAVTAVVVLYAMLFPRRTLLFMFVLPLPAWLVGAVMVGFDILGTLGHPLPGAAHVAYAAHLGGAAFAFAYFYFHWNFGNLLRPVTSWFNSRNRPSLKVFKPEERGEEVVTDEEVDRILSKIHSQGEGSLTSKERRIMENASREYRRRRSSE